MPSSRRANPLDLPTRTVQVLENPPIEVGFSRRRLEGKPPYRGAVYLFDKSKFEMHLKSSAIRMRRFTARVRNESAVGLCPPGPAYRVRLGAV